MKSVTKKIYPEEEEKSNLPGVHEPQRLRILTFFPNFRKMEKPTMKNICKSFFAFIVASSAFLIGFYLGTEKVKSKIPDFQEDVEEKS